MRDLGIQKPLLQEIITDHPKFKNYYGLRKLIRDYLQDKLHVAVYDSCCPAASPEGIFPVRFDSENGDLEYFNGTAWVSAPLESVGGTELAIGDTTISDDGGIVNSNMLVPFYPQGPQTDIAAGTGGAITLTEYFTTINTDAGGDAFTLADGTVVGQVKRIRLVVDGGGDGVVTPANFTATTITFNDAGDDVELMWDGTQWFPLVNIGATIA